MTNLRLTPSQLNEAYTVGVEIELPSGLLVRVRPVSIMQLINEFGFVPDELTAAVTQLHQLFEDMSGGDYTPDQLKNLQEQLTYLRRITKGMLISPTVVDTHEEITDPNEQILAEWLTEEDVALLFALVDQSAKSLYTFRQRQEEPAESVGVEPGLPSEAEPDIRSHPTS